MAEIRLFLEDCSRPAVLEWGDEAVPLLPDRHAWEVRNGNLFLSAWPEERSIHRRVIGIESRKPGVMVCSIQKFGGATGRINLLDLNHPRAGGAVKQGARRNFSAGFRQMLTRRFPGWSIQTLTTEMSLERSFSPKYPRAILENGSARVAALACPLAEDEHHFLSFALLWHHYVSGEVRNHANVPLALFLPDSAGNLTALRLKWLRVAARLFRFNEHGSAGEIDPADLGNLETKIVSRPMLALSPDLEHWVERLCANFGTEMIQNADATWRLRLRGLEFARIANGEFYASLEGQPHLTEPEHVQQLAAHLAEIRHPEAGNREHPLFRAEPESWLESMVTRQIGTIDSALEDQPVLRQIIAFAAADRDVIDLIGASPSGQVSVIELKAAEDIHLPLQALDYWMRVEWHIRKGELDQFFPKLQIAKEFPKLVLVAPAMQFHPSNELILSYFNEQIETERIGVNLEWQQGLKVAFRLHGSEKPQSHRRSL